MKKYTEVFLQSAHNGSIFHESKIIGSEICGCFHCKKTFDKNEITVWTDIGSEKGKTAMCPYCGIDSVLSDEYPIHDPSFLASMNKMWF